jgi:hypothetical protein
MTLYAAMIFDWAVFVKLSMRMQTFELDWSNCFEIVGAIFITSNLASSQFAVAH